MDRYASAPVSIPHWLFLEEGSPSWHSQTAMGRWGTEDGDEFIGGPSNCTGGYFFDFPYDDDKLEEALEQVWATNAEEEFSGLDGNELLVQASPIDRRNLLQEVGFSIEEMTGRLGFLQRAFRQKLKRANLVDQELLNMRRELSSLTRLRMIARRKAQRAFKVCTVYDC
jgi:hypothetical protein